MSTAADTTSAGPRSTGGVSRRRFLGAVVATGTLARRSVETGVRPAQATSGPNGSTTPAILGGTPVRRTPFPSWPVADAREEEALVRVLRSGRWNRGERKPVRGGRKASHRCIVHVVSLRF